MHNVLVGSVSFASPGAKALHNASTAQEITVITPSATNFQIKVSRLPSTDHFRISDTAPLASVGMIPPPSALPAHPRPRRHLGLLVPEAARALGCGATPRIAPHYPSSNARTRMRSITSPINPCGPCLSSTGFRATARSCTARMIYWSRHFLRWDAAFSIM